MTRRSSSTCSRSSMQTPRTCVASPSLQNGTCCFGGDRGVGSRSSRRRKAGSGQSLGRSSNETTPKLARRIWLSILMRELKVSSQQRRRAQPLVAFDIPLRRKFPISQPAILRRLDGYNKARTYDFRVKPGGFVQAVTPSTRRPDDDPLPIAPFERDLAKSRKLPAIRNL